MRETYERIVGGGTRSGGSSGRDVGGRWQGVEHVGFGCYLVQACGRGVEGGGRKDVVRGLKLEIKIEV